MKRQLFFVKLQLSLRTTAWVLSQWRYALLMLVSALLFFELVYWLFNVSLFMLVMGGNLSVLDKLVFLLSPFRSVASTNGALFAGMMAVLAMLQGISVAVLAYTIRRQRTFDIAAVGSGSVVGLLAIIGLGCPACGTSLITPVVALFVSGSAVAISDSITAIALPFAIMIALYGIYTLGVKAAGARARTDAHVALRAAHDA